MMDRHPGEILGSSESARVQRLFVDQAAGCDSPVTLTGEPGTGKQLTATLIHEASTRQRHPLIAVDCSLYYERELKRELFGFQPSTAGAKPRRGVLELATKGTCYLSRIEELTPGLQLELLRFLASRRVRRLGDGKEISSGVRVIVSSDKNLTGLVQSGLFDRELYDKLCALSLQLNPVRTRPADILKLVEYCAQSRSTERATLRTFVLADDAVSALEAYPWPGNFDELVKEVDRLLDSGATVVRSQSLSTEISSYWLGQHCDPEVRKALEELDGYIREFRILSRLEADLGEPAAPLAGWADECCHQRDLLEET